MYIKSTTIINPTGLHARPAGAFVKEAAKFKSVITVKNVTTISKVVSAKSISLLMTLGLSKGTVIEISAEGEDEISAVDSLIAFVDGGLGEV